jgi:hypothetical protein
MHAELGCWQAGPAVTAALWFAADLLEEHHVQCAGVILLGLHHSLKVERSRNLLQRQQHSQTTQVEAKRSRVPLILVAAAHICA